MKIYVARHGQTDWNKEKRAQGSKDIELNETGIQQAEELGEKLKTLDFDVCYASPLKRAAKTAEIAVNGKCKIIYDDRLRERSFGEFEGKVVKSWSELIDGVNIDDIELVEIPGGVEPVRELVARFADFLNDLKTKYSDGTKILIVGHGGYSKAIEYFLNGGKYGEWYLSNGEIKEYEV